MNKKTTRQWSTSPNHQTAGLSLELVAVESRQMYAENHAQFAQEVQNYFPIHPMERVRQWLGRMASQQPLEQTS